MRPVWAISSVHGRLGELEGRPPRHSLLEENLSSYMYFNLDRAQIIYSTELTLGTSTANGMWCPTNKLVHSELDSKKKCNDAMTVTTDDTAAMLNTESTFGCHNEF